MSAVGNRKVRYIYTWTEENCAELPSSIEKGKSRYFVTNIDGNIMHWQVGVTQQFSPPRHYLNFYLISKKPHADAHDNSMETGVMLTVHLKNKKGETSTQQRRYTFNNKNYTTYSFGSYEYFTDLKKHFGFESAGNGTLRGFSLTLICDIFFDVPTVCSDDDDVIAAMSLMSLASKESDKLESGEDYLAGETDSSCDVKIIAGGKEFRAHKSVLQLHSKVFSEMFARGTPEASENIVKAEDVDAEVMREVLRFAYDGRVRDVDRLAGGLFAAAEKYKMEGLKDFCEGEIIKVVCLANFERFIELANRYKAEKLKRHMIDFLAKRVNEYSKIL